MSDVSPRIAAKLLKAGQASKFLVHNEFVFQADALLGAAIQDRDLSAPPGSPTFGHTWFIAAGASGAWLGQSGKIAQWSDSGWRFFTPWTGLAVWIVDEALFLRWTGAAWAAFGAGLRAADLPDFAESVDDRVGALLVAGANVTLTYNDGANTLTIASSAGGGVSDGDKGDVVVSGSGTVWTLDSIPHDIVITRDGASAAAFYEVTGDAGFQRGIQLRTNGVMRAQFGLDAAAELGANAGSNVRLTTFADGGGTLSDVIIVNRASGAVTLSNNLTVGGNLTVNGTTYTVNATTVTYDDIILTVGGDAAPVADDAKDRGMLFRWHNGTVAKIGFFGWDRSAQEMMFIPDATDTADVISGAVGTVRAALNGNASTASAWATGRTITITGDATGASGSFDGSANLSFALAIATVSSGAKGLAPASGGGTVNFLRADGAWAAPSGGGGITFAQARKMASIGI